MANNLEKLDAYLDGALLSEEEGPQLTGHAAAAQPWRSKWAKERRLLRGCVAAIVAVRNFALQGKASFVEAGIQSPKLAPLSNAMDVFAVSLPRDCQFLVADVTQPKMVIHLLAVLHGGALVTPNVFDGPGSPRPKAPIAQGENCLREEAADAHDCEVHGETFRSGQIAHGFERVEVHRIYGGRKPSRLLIGAERAKGERMGYKVKLSALAGAHAWRCSSRTTRPPSTTPPLGTHLSLSIYGTPPTSSATAAARSTRTTRRGS